MHSLTFEVLFPAVFAIREANHQPDLLGFEVITNSDQITGGSYHPIWATKLGDLRSPWLGISPPQASFVAPTRPSWRSVCRHGGSIPIGEVYGGDDEVLACAFEQSVGPRQIHEVPVDFLWQG